MSRKFQNIKNIILDNDPVFKKVFFWDIVSYTLIIAITIYFIWISNIRLWGFDHPNSEDLGGFNQVFWNLLHHGNANAYLFFSENADSFFNWFPSYSLWLLVPIYFISQSVMTLITIKCLCMGLTLLFLYKTSKLILNDSLISFCFLIVCCTYQPLFVQTQNGFQTPFINMMFMSLCLYSFYKSNIIIFCLSLITAYLTRNDVFLYSGSFILLALFAKNKRPFLLATILIFIGYIILVPFKDTRHIAIWAHLGNNVPEIIKTMIIRPKYIVNFVISNMGKSQFYYLFYNLYFFPLLSPLIIIGIIPYSLALLLTPTYIAAHWLTKYISPLIPFILTAFILSLFSINKYLKLMLIKLNHEKYIHLIRIFILSLLLFMIYKNIWVIKHYYHVSSSSYSISEANKFKDIIKLIPYNAGVSAQWGFAPILSSRDITLLFPYGLTNNRIAYILINPNYSRYPLDNIYLEACNNLIKNKDFGVFSINGDFILFKRGYNNSLNNAAKKIVDKFMIFENTKLKYTNYTTNGIVKDKTYGFLRSEYTNKSSTANFNYRFNQNDIKNNYIYLVIIGEIMHNNYMKIFISNDNKNFKSVYEKIGNNKLQNIKEYINITKNINTSRNLYIKMEIFLNSKTISVYDVRIQDISISLFKK